MAGGHTGHEPLNDALLLDNDFHVVSSFENALNPPRYMHTASDVGSGAVVIAGGFADDYGEVTDAIDVFLEGSFDSSLAGQPNLNTPRAGHTATVLGDGRVLIAGGQSSKSVLNTSEIISFVRSANHQNEGSVLVEAAPSLNHERAFHTAVRLKDGRVLVMGGQTLQNRGLYVHYSIDDLKESILDSIEIFDPQNGWEPQKSKLQIARSLHTATLLENGQVLVTGGFTPQGTSAPAEIYDPDKGTGYIIMTPHSLAGQTATLLEEEEEKENRVLLVGGGSVDLIGTPRLELAANSMIYAPCDATTSGQNRGCGEGGGDIVPGPAEPPGHNPAAASAVEFQGGGCVKSPGVTQDGCGTSPSAGGSPWALLLMLLAARRSAGRRAPSRCS
ncbi:Kelch repeat-containing protein [Sorangium cellulosum]|uniref:Kelch repeat-containing protein n=1 Tax=Sorangium cellulosum TaxID=56 RepID=UPI001A931FF0|nr:kelch repeat-containing protein [Sorangium cellulosum]